MTKAPAVPESEDPFARFSMLYKKAEETWQHISGTCALDGAYDFTAATLCTVDPSGQPTARVVLVKEIGPDGLCFYTNRESRKGRDIAFNPRVGLCFYWPWLGSQVRVEGAASHVESTRSDAYFSKRPRNSQLGAWASRQSRPMADRAAFDETIRTLDSQWAGQPVPRPPHWGGYLVVPARYEFWQAGAFRWHQRTEYVLEGARWRVNELYP